MGCTWPKSKSAPAPSPYAPVRVFFSAGFADLRADIFKTEPFIFRLDERYDRSPPISHPRANHPRSRKRPRMRNDELSLNHRSSTHVTSTCRVAHGRKQSPNAFVNLAHAIRIRRFHVSAKTGQVRGVSEKQVGKLDRPDPPPTTYKSSVNLFSFFVASAKSDIRFRNDNRAISSSPPPPKRYMSSSPADQYGAPPTSYFLQCPPNVCSSEILLFRGFQ